MNKDQFKGGVRELCGKLQEGFGKLVGNPFQQDMGAELQVKGDHRYTLEISRNLKT